MKEYESSKSTLHLALYVSPSLRLLSNYPPRPSIYQWVVRPPRQSSILVESAALSPISQRRVFELQSKPLAQTLVPSWILTSPKPGFNLPDPRTAAAETIANLIIWSDINPPRSHSSTTRTPFPPPTSCPRYSCSDMCVCQCRHTPTELPVNKISSHITFIHIHKNSSLPHQSPFTSSAARDALSLSGPKTPSSYADKTWMQMMPGWFHFFIFFFHSLVQSQNGSLLNPSISL